MEITLYKFSKKVNSTARPTGNGTVVNVSLKSNVPVANSFDQSADTYLTNPVFFLSTIDSGVSGDVNAYNYCRAFGHWYWIRNIEISLDGSYTFFCEIDVLASFRTNIIGSRQYVSYGSADVNRNIDDTRIALSNLVTRRRVSDNLTIPGQSSSDHFTQYHMIITTDHGTFPVFLTPAQFSDFTEKFLLNSHEGDTMYEAIVDLQNVFGAPIYCIGSMHGLYYEWQGTTSELSIELGGHTFGTGKFATAQSYQTTYQIDIDNGVPLESRGNRCTQYFLNLPFVGLVQCDNGIINQSEYLRASFMVDALSLDVGYYVRNDQGAFVAEGYGNVGQELMFGQIVNPNTAAGTYEMYKLGDVLINKGGDVATSAINFGGSMALESRNAGHALDAVGSSIVNFTQSALSTMLSSDMSGYQAAVSRSGTRGGASGGSMTPINNHVLALYAYTSEYVIDPTTVGMYFGRPVFKIQTLVGDGRLVVCPNPIIELDTVSGIITQLLKLMKGGIYLE